MVFKLFKRSFGFVLLAFLAVAVLYYVFELESSDTKAIEAANSSTLVPVGRTAAQRKLAQQAQTAVRITPQSSTQPLRLELDQLPDLAAQVRLAEASMAESFTDF